MNRIIRLIVLALLLGCLAGCSHRSMLSIQDAPPPSPPPTSQDDLPGSLRGARIAMPITDPEAPVIYLATSLTKEDISNLHQQAPNLRIYNDLSPEEALELAPQAHGIDGRYCNGQFLAKATNLRWVQCPSAGVAWLLETRALRDSEQITLTNMAGVHGPTIADHVFGMLLALTRDLRYYMDDAQQGTWNRKGSGAQRIALQGRTLFVVGLGGIGREVAKRAKGFGMRVIATRRSAAPPPSYVDMQGTPDRLMEFLAASDVVVLCVPLTDETAGMIGEEQLAAMPSGSYLVNIARGGVVQTEALVAALSSGHLAGAALDVTDPEPLPGDHVLWTMDNVVITPHVASRSELTGERWNALYVENLRRFAAGEPLLNVVDKQAGY
jgi:D-2-hydroxyacid dehydrogenase (NADP+)